MPAVRSEETPPRAWGRQPFQYHCTCTQRNTPTCVGKTLCAGTTMTTMKKHPHVRGEDCESGSTAPARTETPPRAWGRRPAQTCPFARGNTPTCVGKTQSGPVPSIREMKHPHVRGEDCKYHTIISAWIETPPRAWGRPGSTASKIIDFGNTPTCVGKTYQKGTLQSP